MGTSKFRIIREISIVSAGKSHNTKQHNYKTNSKNYRENVFGYRGLKIDLWMSAASLKAYARMKADETISPSQSEGVQPDPVLPPLVKILAEGQVTESVDAFTTEILSDKETKFKPYGEKITEFEIQESKDEGKLYWFLHG